MAKTSNLTLNLTSRNERGWLVATSSPEPFVILGRRRNGPGIGWSKLVKIFTLANLYALLWWIRHTEAGYYA